MNTVKVNSIGLMSGTSLDGLDIVYVQFESNNYSVFDILYSKTVSYTPILKKKLNNAITFSKKELIDLDLEYGRFLGKEVVEFIQENQIKKIDFIASHGHTVFHEPDKGITLQIGNGQIISDITNCKVVCDFRTQDVKFGGQGAPLVPIGDELLFSKYDSCLNLGGFANISFKKDHLRIAYDICPVNIVLNFYVNQLGVDFDDKGKIASKGNLNTELLSALSSLDFYKKNPPKSLGLEWVQQNILPLIDKNEKDIPTILRTFIEHASVQIGKNLSYQKNVFITGGGVFNEFLIERIKFHTKSKVIIPNSQIVNYKEALVFAFLGLLRVDNQVNCLKSVTGASKDHSSGRIFIP